MTWITDGGAIRGGRIMCIACSFQCCVSDEFEGCGCMHCDCEECRADYCIVCGEPREGIEAYCNRCSYDLD